MTAKCRMGHDSGIVSVYGHNKFTYTIDEKIFILVILDTSGYRSIDGVQYTPVLGSILSKKRNISKKSCSDINKWSSRCIISYKTMNYLAETNRVAMTRIPSTLVAIFVKIQITLPMEPNYDKLIAISVNTGSCSRRRRITIISVLIVISVKLHDTLINRKSCSLTESLQ